MASATASRFARALVESVTAPASRVRPEQASAELRAFAEAMLGSLELRNVMVSPAVNAAKKRAVVDRLAGMLPLSPIVRNFILICIDRRRSGMLTEIADAFDSALDEKLGLQRADVVSAAPLEEAQRDEICRELGLLVTEDVRCSFRVDPELIGGVQARIGSTLYDGSVRGRLQSLRSRLMNS